MPNKKAADSVYYQRRAQEFSVGDSAYLFNMSDQSQIGRVVAVWPAIGMVDMEFPNVNLRLPVEDLQRYDSSKDFIPPKVENDTLPDGNNKVPVSDGIISTDDDPVLDKMASEIADSYVKRALYWAERNRQYRASDDELSTESYVCPRCKSGVLRKTNYKRRDGKSLHLLACTECLFLIKRSDIIGDPNYGV
jgi:hypothetical protein